jgi:anti-sigma factor RsiW
MSVSDTDIELLEAHLDGELSSAQDAALRNRLASDHDLAMELTSLRADRAIRTEVFQSCEPDDLAVKNLVLNVRKQITRDAVRGDRLRILRYIASAAAVVMISFSAGWLGKGRTANPNPDAQPPVAVASHDNSGSTPTGYQVNLTDPFGHILAVQHFDTLEEARQFSEDVAQTERQQQNRATEPVVYKEQF